MFGQIALYTLTAILFTGRIPVHDEEIQSIEEPACSQNTYKLPIKTPKGASIAQGPINTKKGRSHGYLNCLYALDLASEYAEPPATILAAKEGVVIKINTGCTADDPISYHDSCGDGFGNWIGILHQNNEISFYAHLETVLVEEGQTVTCGETIGIEGVTGLAGKRHLHFSIHSCPNENLPSDPPYYYPTIPYKLQYNSPPQQLTTDIRNFQGLDWEREFFREPRMFATK